MGTGGSQPAALRTLQPSEGRRRSLAHVQIANQYTILKSCLHNPAMFDKLSLNLNTKMLLARVLTISQRADGMWNLITAINSLRNGLGHFLDAVQRDMKFEIMPNPISESWKIQS